MKQQIKGYLRAKNILWILLAWLCITFINPAGNGWLFVPEEYAKNWGFYFVGDAIFIMLCFSFKYLIDRDYKKVMLLATLGLVNTALVYVLVFYFKVSTSIIPFIHPISLALPAIYTVEKNFKLAIVGYLMGYALSFGPLLFSVVPILFVQLWLGSLNKPILVNKISRFLSRVFICAITSVLCSFFLYSIALDQLMFSAVSYSKLHEVLMSFLALVAVYLVLNQYLKVYYSEYGNRLLRVLAYFPVLWAIPLIAILFEEAPD